MPAVPSQLISISRPQQSQPERRVPSELLTASSAPPPTSTLSVLLLTPVASNLFRVFLSDEPRHRSVLGAHDAMNRLLWTLSLASGPVGATTPAIEQIENPQIWPGGLP